MPVSTKKLLDLLADRQPAELRQATLLVLLALEVKDPEVGPALLGLLADRNEELRLGAVRLLGKLKYRPALKPLLAQIEAGGPVAEAAAAAVAHLGDKGVAALHELMPKVAPGLRRYIGAALAALTSLPSERLGVLRDSDPGVVEAAVHTLQEQIPALSTAERRKLFEQLLKLAQQAKPPLPPASELAVIRLLGTIDEPKAAKVLWPRLKSTVSFDVRSHALQVLGQWPLTPTAEQWSLLFACAQDEDFRIASLALLLLKKLPAAKEAQEHWVELLAAPDVSVRKLALEKLASADSKAVVAALAEQLGHPDEGLRNAALARLVTTPAGRKLLTSRLLAEPTADRTWTLARALARHLTRFDAAWRTQIFQQACKYLESEDRRADPLLFLLREADAKKLRDSLEDQALASRKKKDYAKALGYLKLLARDPALGFPLRFELAACGLKLSAKELETRQNDPCLHQFAQLCHQDEPALLKAIETSKWLDGDDLYYLGFHFAEAERPYWNFAKEMLTRVVKRSPTSKLAQAAKSKLKRASLG